MLSSLRPVSAARIAVAGGGVAGEFRLGSMESTAAVRLPGLFGRYRAAFPKVEIHLVTGNPERLLALLRSGEIDAAFLAGEAPDDEFDRRPAFVEPLALITARDHPPVTAASLPGTVLVFENGCPHRRLLERWYADCNAVPARRIVLGSYHALLG